MCNCKPFEVLWFRLVLSPYPGQGTMAREAYAPGLCTYMFLFCTLLRALMCECKVVQKLAAAMKPMLSGLEGRCLSQYLAVTIYMEEKKHMPAQMSRPCGRMPYASPIRRRLYLLIGWRTKRLHSWMQLRMHCVSCLHAKYLVYV